ncbi:MAG: UvrD-helicase domain-containing protein [Nitrospinae bacterium]|nr:UvrD-helicase domain-containing protein [Nitrospinota bacterium]
MANPSTPSYLEGLNPAQLEAVLHDEGPLLILAGAGSGKTKVITHRIARLIAEGICKPWELLAVTFTNKAAEEMRSRVAALLGAEADRLWISTFHSACVRILRREIGALGYHPQFVIYDEVDSTACLKEVARAMNISEKVTPARLLKHHISQYKNLCLTPEEVSAEAEAAKFGPASVAARLYPHYQAALKANVALDFDDLLMVTVLLFEQFPEVLGRYQERLRSLLVDEYQDTNHTQYRLLRLLAAGHNNLCVVGDDDQSIYHWRGANIENILNFEADYPDARVVTLEENYRSTQTILDAASAVVAVNKARRPKTLFTSREGGEPLVVFRADDERQEAEFVATTIRALSEEGSALRGAAVFYRTNAQSRVLEEALTRHAIPYQIVRGFRFYDRKEIKDLVGYLRVAVNPEDSVSLRRIINVPPRGIGARTIEVIEGAAAERGVSLVRAARELVASGGLPAATAPKVEAFVHLVDRLVELAASATVSELLVAALEATDMIEHYRQDSSPEATTRLEHIRELMGAVEEFEERAEEPSTIAFLDQAALSSQEDDLDEGAGAVSLMTLHASKGLEFAVVFLTGMENRIFPHARALDDHQDLEEERRLCYVGMTRAKERLFLTYAERRRLHGHTQFYPPSLFLTEIPPEAIHDATPRPADPARDWTEPAAAHPAVEDSFEEALNPELMVGRRVHHPSFGQGQILATEGVGAMMKVTVLFETVGRKKLMAAYANLRPA